MVGGCGETGKAVLGDSVKIWTEKKKRLPMLLFSADASFRRLPKILSYLRTPLGVVEAVQKCYRVRRDMDW